MGHPATFRFSGVPHCFAFPDCHDAVGGLLYAAFAVPEKTGINHIKPQRFGKVFGF
jgi:hypothetical protein